jgi:hypothetical protein
MRQINLLYIHKSLDAVAGKFNIASRLRDCILPVEVYNGKQAELLLKAKLPG